MERKLTDQEIVRRQKLDEIRKVNKKVEIKYLPISANVKKSNFLKII